MLISYTRQPLEILTQSIVSSKEGGIRKEEKRKKEKKKKEKKKKRVSV